MDLGAYLKPLRRMWWLIIAAVLVATIASFLMLRRVPPTYQSHAVLMVGQALQNPNPSNNDLYMSQQLANTYVDILQREQLQNATKAALGLEWLPQYSARIVPATQLMELAVIDTIPERAQAVGSELANQLIRLTPAGTEDASQSRQAFIAQQLDELEASIEATREEISKKQSELASMLSARQIADAQTQITALEGKLGTLQANYASLMQSTGRVATNTISIIEPATLPTEPIGPNRTAMILMAAAIGFVLAAAGAYLLDYLDDTFKNPEDIQKSLGLATLGAVPRMTTGAAQNGLLLGSAPAAVVEAYNVLRTNLQFAAVGERLGSLLVTSSSPHEGKSLTAANLSIALAQASQRVILIDTDLRRPRIHKLFGLSNSVGVTGALLQANLSLDGLLHQTAVLGLRVLTSGPLPPNPSQLLSAKRMQELLARLEAEADIVILDSPPATSVADAAILSTYVDGVLLVVDAETTRHDWARKAIEALKQVNARVIGVALNRVPRSSGYYYQYDSTSDASPVRRNGLARGGLLGAIRPQVRQDQKSASSDS